MALNYLPFLNNPVTKPTGHEPLATFTDKLASGAQNYHGLPIAEDTRPAFAGGGRGPRALLTKPIAHEPATRSNIPLPFSGGVVYNANALHVPDLETMGEGAAKRRLERYTRAVADMYVPKGKPGLTTLLDSEISALEARIQDKVAAFTQQGRRPEFIEAAVEEDNRILRELYNKRAHSDAGINPSYVNVAGLMSKNAQVPMEASEDVRARWERANAAGLQGMGARSIASFFTGSDINALARYVRDAGMRGQHAGGGNAAPGNMVDADAGIAPLDVGAAIVPALGIADDMGQPVGDAPGVPPQAEGVELAAEFQALVNAYHAAGQLTAEQADNLVANYTDARAWWSTQPPEKLRQIADALLAGAGADLAGDDGAGAGAGAGAGPATPERPPVVPYMPTPEELSTTAKAATKAFNNQLDDAGVPPYEKGGAKLPENTLTPEQAGAVELAFVKLINAYKRTIGTAWDKRPKLTRDAFVAGTTPRAKLLRAINNRFNFYSDNIRTVDHDDASVVKAFTELYEELSSLR